MVFGVRGFRGSRNSEASCPKGPRTQVIGFQGPNAIGIIVFGP